MSSCFGEQTLKLCLPLCSGLQVKRVEELLQQELGRHPTEEEVAARSGMSWTKLNYLHK